MRKHRISWFICCLFVGVLLLVCLPFVQTSDAGPSILAASAVGKAPVEKNEANIHAPAVDAAKADDLVMVFSLKGIINPATSDFVTRGLRDAAARHAMLVVLQLDTPGGLDTSMRDITRAILDASVPVATFVSPAGARAASAGAFILYASHIAAMTPGSNLGAASPVSIGMSSPSQEKPPQAAPQSSANDKIVDSDSGDTMTRKVTNDAAAYLRSLAQLRGRNPQFAQDAVLHARSLSSDEALKDNVIDLIAKNIPDLLEQLDGRKVMLGDGREVILHTTSAQIVSEAPDWRTQLLSVIANPQIALVLIMLGIYGLFFEISSPGVALPGVAGLVSVLLGLYAFQLLPVNWAGVALVIAGVAMMIGEVFLPSFGALGVGGIIAFVLGGMMLTDTGIPTYDLSLPFLLGLAAASALFIILTGIMAARAHKRPVVSGREGMQGQTGIVTAITGDAAYAEVEGESWRVRANQPLRQGDIIEVRGMDGLTLQVVLKSAHTANYVSTGGS